VVPRPLRSIYPTVRFCAWAAFLILLALWAVATLSWPLARDQGDFAWAGSVILKGGVLYNDAWDVKGPFTVYTFALAQLVFGHNAWGIRVFDLLIGLVHLIALAVVALRFWDRQAAQYAAVLGALFATWLNFVISSQPDTWCGCIVTIVVAIVSARPRVTLRVIAVASFLVGVCCLQKPVYGVFILLVAPFIERNGRWILKAILAAVIGLSVPILAAVAYFGMRHALGNLVNTYLLFNLRAHLKLGASPLDQVRTFIRAWQDFLPLSVGVPLAMFGAVVLIARNKRFGMLYLLWFSLNLLVLIIQGKYFEYQWVPLVAPVALGAAVGLRQFREFRPAAATAVLATFILLFINDPLRSVKEWVLYRAGKISPDDYYSHFVYLNKNHFDALAIRRLAAYVEEHSATNDTVQVWGFDAGINYLANRGAPSRFGYTYPLQIGKNNPYQDSYRAEFLEKIRSRPPRYVLVPSDDAFGLMPVSSDQSFNDFTAFRDFVRAHYDDEKRLANWTLYRLRGQ
jgi:hypothetical protein